MTQTRPLFRWISSPPELPVPSEPSPIPLVTGAAVTAEPRRIRDESRSGLLARLSHSPVSGQPGRKDPSAIR